MLRWATAQPILRGVGSVGGALDRIGIKPGADLAEMAVGIASLGDGERRAAFVRTARSIASTRGQRVSAADRLYLAAEVPVLLVWGDRDPVPRRFTRDALTALLTKAGFTVVETHGVRVFADLVPSRLVDTEPGAADALIELEEAAAAHPALRDVATQLHLLARAPGR